MDIELCGVIAVDFRLGSLAALGPHAAHITASTRLAELVDKENQQPRAELDEVSTFNTKLPPLGFDIVVFRWQIL